jgi:hypothetical protein
MNTCDCFVIVCSHQSFVELLPFTYGKSRSTQLEDYETRQPIELMDAFSEGSEDWQRCVESKMTIYRLVSRERHEDERGMVRQKGFS